MRSIFYLFTFLSFHLFNKEIHALSEQVVTGVATIDAVVAIGIYQLAEVLVSLHQCLGIFRSVTEMHVIVSTAVTEQESTLQLPYPTYRVLVVAAGILLRGTHKPLRIDSVVETP